MSEDNSVKKIFGKSAEELIAEARETAKAQEKRDKERSQRLKKELFETHAGPEELKHFHWLLTKLDDSQLARLAVQCGVASGPDDIDRDILIYWLEETNRESFYSEYHKVLEKSKS